MSTRALVPMTLLAAVFFSGCAHQLVSNPSKITLEDAMASVGRGFVQLTEAEKDLHVGLVPSDVTVTFNVAASAQDSSKLYIDLSPEAAQGIAKAGGEVGSTLSTSRGNQITVKFANVFLADEKTLINRKNATELDAALAVIQKYGTIFLTNK